ncbi:MAG: hypothetical protein ABMB14_19565 [Myxococcota bacterium]
MWWILAGCGPEPLDVFLALPADFEGFRDWETFAPVGDGHGEVQRTIYANDRALSDDAAFVVGSVIVKVSELPDGPVTHAMARRADDYNVNGAVGWEWMELDHVDAAVPRIVWRGEAPPEGEEYALFGDGDTGASAPATGDCNTCHGAAFANQYVFSVPLGG